MSRDLDWFGKVSEEFRVFGGFWEGLWGNWGCVWESLLGSLGLCYEGLGRFLGSLGFCLNRWVLVWQVFGEFGGLGVGLRDVLDLLGIKFGF